MKYEIVAVLWQDHTSFSRFPLNEHPEDLIIPSLTVGILFSETEKTVSVLGHIEKYTNGDSLGDMMVIYKDSIINKKVYGKIKLKGLDKGG